MGINLAETTNKFFLVSLLELIFIIVPLIVMKIQKKDLKYEFIHRISPNPRTKGRRLIDILLGFLLGIIFLFIGYFIWFWTRKLIISIWGNEFYNSASEGSVNTNPPSLNSWELAFTIFIMYALVGLSEEFFFRGILLKELKKRSFALGLMGSSLIFALYHVFPGIVPIQTLLSFWPYYFVFGVMLGGISILQKGDLLTAIIAHGTFNSVLFILSYS